MGGSGFARLCLIKTTVLCALQVLSVCGFLFAQEPPKPAQPQQDEFIQPGNKLSINVWRHQDLTREAVVDEAGKISFPLLGEVKAAGKTLSELKAELTELLGKDYIVDPYVTVAINRAEEKKQCYIYGEVKRPGSFIIEPGLTLLKAVTLAGGISDYASQVVYVKRKVKGKEKRIKMNINNVINGNEEDIAILPEDIIVATKRMF